jgi:hypothetical protein
MVGEEPTRRLDSGNPATDQSTRDGDVVLDHADLAFLLAEGYHQPTGKPWEDPELDKIPRSSIPDRRWPIPLQWTAAHTIPYVFNCILTAKSAAVYHKIAALYPEDHPGVPPARPIYDRNELEFDHRDIVSYKNPIQDIPIKHGNVLEQSRAIYHAIPEIDMQTKAYLRGPETKSQRLSLASIPVAGASRTWVVRGQEAAIALLARLILRASDRVSTTQAGRTYLILQALY